MLGTRTMLTVLALCLFPLSARALMFTFPHDVKAVQCSGATISSGVTPCSLTVAFANTSCPAVWDEMRSRMASPRVGLYRSLEPGEVRYRVLRIEHPKTATYTALAQLTGSASDPSTFRVDLGAGAASCVLSACLEPASFCSVRSLYCGKAEGCHVETSDFSGSHWELHNGCPKQGSSCMSPGA
mmetsp:Transcript_15030/g.35205  ORF Transcript_15030/g.35205 Transcript_15030/m.35205 type:complete len:184 (+) Transcript_15030:63-614(+)